MAGAKHVGRWLVRHRFVALAVLALVLAVFAGREGFARLAYRIGLPGLAAPALHDEAARGAALFDAGRYEEADDTFRTIGRRVTYNRGNSLAATGDYKLSAAYYDAVLFANRFDADARHNRTLVDELIPETVGEAKGRGRIRAFLSEAGVEAAAFDPDNPHVPVVADPYSYRKAIDARTVAAGREWIETLTDAPGAYLRKRLVAEYDRRREEGIPAPSEPSPW